MEKQSIRALNTQPSDSLHALKSVVAARFDWRMLTGGNDDHPRFMIEKQVRYDLLRGLPMYIKYQIVGNFQKNTNGETILQYAVSGDGGSALFYSALHVGVILVMAVILGLFVLSPAGAGNWIGILLLGVLLLSTIVYCWFAFRRHQEHMAELNQFMDEFAQRMGR